jgi:hypothetical protein
MRKPDLTWVYVLITVIAALLWARELMAGAGDFHFTHYRVINNTKICFYENDEGDVLTITVDQRDACPARL